MNNPLVLFVGAAVAAVAVLAGVTADRWQDWPAAFRTTAASPDAVEEPSRFEPDAPAPERKQVQRKEVPTEPEVHDQAAEPDVEAARPAEDVQEAPADAFEAPSEPDRLAVLDPREPRQAGQPEAQPVVPPEAAVEPEAGPESESETTMEPSFDVVREDDGALLVAGRAAPGAEVALRVDGEVIATDVANERGEWMFMPPEPLPSGTHYLRVEARDPLGAGTGTTELIGIAVAERAADRAAAMHSEPAQPPRRGERIAEPAEAGRQEAAGSEPTTAAEAPRRGAEEQKLSLAPLPRPDTERDEAEADRPTPQQIEPPAVRQLQPEDHAALAPDPEPEPEVDQPTQALDVPLAIESIDYGRDGDMLFSGRARPGRTVRIYVDNELVGEAAVDRDGHWEFADGDRITAGRHTLRADLTGAGGEVLARILLPFVRAGNREIAALVDARRAAAARQQPAAPTTRLGPSAPTETTEPTPEPEDEPDSPAAAADVAPEPEPEPEAPAVAEDMAAEPEPEPEAPAVAEDIAPEPAPESEAPAVAEDIAPEPEPDSSAHPRESGDPEELAPPPGLPSARERAVAEEHVAPEPAPESEAPAVAEDVAPEPEPDLFDRPRERGDPEELAPPSGFPPARERAVAEEDIAPEPEWESEAPALAEDIAPEREPEPKQEPGPDPSGAQVAEAPSPTGAVALQLPRIAPVPATERPRVAAAPEHPAGAAPSDEPEVAPVQPGHVVIQPGNNLWTISRVIYGRGIEYTAIYKANRDKIRDPDLIYPGQILTTPGVNPPREIDPQWREPLEPEDLARRNAAQ